MAHAGAGSGAGAGTAATAAVDPSSRSSLLRRVLTPGSIPITQGREFHSINVSFSDGKHTFREVFVVDTRCVLHLEAMLCAMHIHRSCSGCVYAGMNPWSTLVEGRTAVLSRLLIA